jgi:GNAT superfamily N-acetyltransferase
MIPGISVGTAHPGFDQWNELLRLLHAAFEYQKDRIKPPSSLYLLDEVSLAEKAGGEQLLLAWLEGEIVGCVFVRSSTTSTYLGKLAVSPALQGKGLGKLLVQAVEEIARKKSHNFIELETRIELTANHLTFSRLGFTKVSEHAHEGFDRPTYIRMQKKLIA